MDVKRNNWLSVNTDGLSQHYEKNFILRELLANAFDEENCTNVKVNINLIQGNEYLIQVIDNCKGGFENIEDMFTLFRKTKKADDTTVRGRFNHGEKGVLSLCNKAILTSTKGTVYFNPDGTRTIDNTVKTQRGSDLSFYVNLNQNELLYLLDYIKFIKIPKGFVVSVNNIEYYYEKPKHIIEAKLLTWKSDEKNGYYKNTEVFIYPKINGKSFIMELGIPIQEIDYLFTIDIRQKIPLDTKRNFVKNTYLEDLYGQLANHNFFLKQLTDDNIAEDFVAIAMSSDYIQPESAKKIVEKKMGSDKLIIANPKDLQANERAIQHGYTLIQSRDIPKSTREAIKTVGITTTSEMFKEDVKNGIKISKKEWTNGMRWIEKISRQFAQFSINKDIVVEFYNNSNVSELASYCNLGILNYNMGRLGHNFFDLPKQNIDRISSILIHELSHDLQEKENLPHLSMMYIKELERIAGKFVEWLMDINNYQSFYYFL